MIRPLSFGVIGRGEWLFDTVIRLVKDGYRPTFIITAREAPEYSKKAADYKNLARSLGVPFLQTTTLSSPDTQDFLDNVHRTDCVVSVNYSNLIGADTIDRYPLGILNAHGGDLPRYRGNACQAWAILNGEENIGICIHRMVPDELDSGAIIARTYLPINLETKINFVFKWFETIIPELYSNALAKLSSEPGFILETQSTLSSDTLRCFPRCPEDGEVDWSVPADQIVRLVNASGAPFVGAYSNLEDVRLHFFDAVIIKEEEKYCAVPGQILRINYNFKTIDVATGFGTVRFSEIANSQGISINFNQIFRSIRQRFTTK